MITLLTLILVTLFIIAVGIIMILSGGITGLAIFIDIGIAGLIIGLFIKLIFK